MSFGRPGGWGDSFKVTPPQRGSFPLDHDGECKTFMLSYMKCLKSHGSDGGQCRPEARDYLACRMDKGLMERDSMQNLGLGDVGATGAAATTPAATATSAKTTPKPEEMERI
ncbi:Cytochrome c oxidase assembly protein COX19 [Vanrija pseudolonga]|uniref:Cytochrome c oxidase assembly protein COX19 n=1 Tax=Vanrija pseudolonga TaxID=143232 RepID=A0AAF1BTR2_9TREE|nr:Cytochrome c oxidase assembly protein COX19 [Vanrija pseudolonga]